MWRDSFKQTFLFSAQGRVWIDDSRLCHLRNRGKPGKRNELGCAGNENDIALAAPFKFNPATPEKILEHFIEQSPNNDIDTISELRIHTHDRDVAHVRKRPLVLIANAVGDYQWNIPPFGLDNLAPTPFASRIRVGVNRDDRTLSHLFQQDLIKAKSRWNIVYVEKTAQTMANMKMLANATRNAFAVIVMLGVAQKYLNLLQIPDECFAILPRPLKVFEIMSEHATELVCQLTD
ncbi:hypothetical protein C7410_12269 [Paraburkholderia silvatlantica]|uniref:Uncharacterized protein n=1 Tax=Paraburkholderia silvatlantica TaxID=321895 RepID=A0A2V4TNW8_9BURK|nr:hypothetical protein C7410_12269 [Paraburkholderia silvatlantica]